LQYLLLFFAIFIFPLSLYASDTRYYDVEIIMYEQLQAENLGAEQWQVNIEREVPEVFIELNSELPKQLNLPENILPELSFRKLPSTAYRLSEEATTIEESPGHHVLLHTAWVQPGLPQDASINVHINKTFPAGHSNDFNNKNQETTLQAPAIISSSGTLDALIRISLARYLHIETDVFLSYDESPRTINYTELQSNQTNEPPLTQSWPKQYHIKQTRNRIRSTELHYLDHPVLGMLILFTPHEVVVKNNPVNKTGSTGKPGEKTTSTRK